jgi:DNA-binding MarR family transcriptional regulator
MEKKEVQVQQTYTKKYTYLLSHPFPEESIDLGKTKYSVLDLLYKKGNPYSISKSLKLSRPTIIQHLEELRDKFGLVKKGANNESRYGDSWEITEKGRFLIEKCVGFPIVSSHNDKTEDKKVRGHGFIWKIKPDKKFDWISLLKKMEIEPELKGISNTPRIIINHKKVWLGNNYITIFEPKWNSFFNKTPLKSRNNAIYEMTEDIDKLKGILEIEFNYKFTCRRQHYGFVDNPEAKFFIKKKKKIMIKNETGFWFSIDFSQNKYEEAETIHEKTGLIDGTNYQDYMNSQKRTGFKVTPEFLLTALNKQNEVMTGIQQNQVVFDKNMASHLKVLNKIGNAIERLGKEREKKQVKSNQKNLGEWL